MSASEGTPKPASNTTEITVVTGDRYRVDGGAKEIEGLILAAARGSLMQLAWLVEAETGDRLAFNPESIVLLRAVGPETDA